MSELGREYEQCLDWAYRVFRFVPYILAVYPGATQVQIAQNYSRDYGCPYDLAYECVGLALEQVRGRACTLGCVAGRPVCWYGLALVQSARQCALGIPDGVWLGDFTLAQRAAFDELQRLGDLYSLHIGSPEQKDPS